MSKQSAKPPADLKTSLTKLKTGFNRHAGVIFVIVILAAVVYSVSSVNLLINAASDDAYRSEKERELTSTQFNRKTIEKIEALGERDNPPTPTLPAGRINPFLE